MPVQPLSIRIKKVIQWLKQFDRKVTYPIILGGTPITAAVTNFPTMGSFSLFAMERLARSTAAAPSETWDALPLKPLMRGLSQWAFNDAYQHE